MKTDIYETITNRIINLIEKGVGEYKLPWRQVTKFEFPKNAVTKNAYKGINLVSLWCEEVDRGYSSGFWGTYNQWKSLGGQVRKDEKATPIVFWKSLPNDSEERKEKTKSKPLIVSHSNVFNAEQVDGLEVKLEDERKINSVEEFFSNVGADIRHGGNEAFYSVNRDYIYMPYFQSFESAQDYYATLCHELTHNADFRIMPRDALIVALTCIWG